MRAKPAFISLLCVSASLLNSCGPAPAPKKAPDPPKILSFYATPGVIPKGEESLICYGTESISEVKLDPPVESLKPSLTRCFNVKPEVTTEYILTASGAGGETSQKLTVTVSGVKKAAPAAGAQLIRFFVSDTKEASPGAKVTLCYGLMNAVSAKITPGEAVPNAERSCISQVVNKTTTFRLEAKSAAGATDNESLTVTVK